MEFCGLCREERELRDSHLMPKALYRTILKSTQSNDILVANVGSKSINYSNDQVKKYFLCQDCEKRLNCFGENIIVPECFKSNGKFKLLDKARSEKTYIENEGVRWLGPELKSIDLEAYQYFAASVIWRASAGDWGENNTNYRNALGQIYQEQLRVYLLGEDKFPQNIYLWIDIDNGELPLSFMSFPSRTRGRECYYHTFHIPGVSFRFVIGANVPSFKNIQRNLQVSTFFSESVFRNSDDFTKLSHVTKNVLIPRGRFKSEVDKHAK